MIHKATQKDARKQLERIFDVYPSYRTQVANNGCALAWANMLHGCDLLILDDVISEIVQGKRQPTEKYQSWDRLAVNILKEVDDREYTRRTKNEQYRKYHRRDAYEKMGAGTRFRMCFELSMESGAVYRAGKITKEENERRVDELAAWDKGGPKPKWIADDSQQQA